MTVEPIDLTNSLDADHLAVLEVLPPDLLDLSDIDRTRAGVEALMAALPAPELPSSVTIEDVMVPGLGSDPDVQVRLYRPDAMAAGSPALYWIHGGGMVLGSVEMNDADCAMRAADFGCLVASVEYRLAPEHPFPAPMHDCYAGLSWLAANAADLGVDTDRIAIGGASAGGGLAAGLALIARDRGGPSICFQLLVYPMLDHRNDRPSTQAITDSRVWNRDANRAGWDAYLGATDRGDVSPYASPSVADDLSGLPPAYINVGQFDMFLDEDVAYAQALLRAGVDCELHIYPGAFHGSNGFVVDSPLSKRWLADENVALRSALFPH
ncbi:MAG: alpha/beta hydrolase [Acidimicrobiia bacterium]|nr:alpha/beta hydrolase [Acidimicrobiia bacterium]